MQIKRELNSAINNFKKKLLYILPILVMLLVTREYFIGYLFFSVAIIIMGYLISLLFVYHRQIFNIFMLHSYDNINFSKFLVNYLRFVINAFCLTFAISILFYEENINFLQYSYPALVFLCAHRFLQYRKNEMSNQFFEIVYSFVIIVLLFAFMRLMVLPSKFDVSSLISISFISIPIIAKEDIWLFVLLTFSVWALLSIIERLKLIKQKSK